MNNRFVFYFDYLLTQLSVALCRRISSPVNRESVLSISLTSTDFCWSSHSILLIDSRKTRLDTSTSCLKHKKPLKKWLMKRKNVNN